MELIWFYIVYGIIFAFGCGYLAKEKGKNVTDWQILGFLLGIIALLIIGLSSKSDKINNQAQNQEIDNATKKCPYCAEIIRLEALKCRYCGEIFDPSDVSKSVEEFNLYKIRNDAVVAIIKNEKKTVDVQKYTC
ncbi:MAG: zinc ribbon domain-containing protein [Desulfamplus sp.]|nr:zinc ribbon domain-containing protein [Desulfamplus sp.]